MAVVEPVQEQTTPQVYSVTLEFAPDTYQLFQAVSSAAGRDPSNAIRYALGLLKLYDQTEQVGGKMLTQIGGQVQEIVNLG